MRDDTPDQVSDLEREGIPETEDPYPGEVASGVRWDQVAAPLDEPLGVEEYGITAAEERLDEPIALRVQREEPDVLSGDDGDFGAIAPEETAVHVTSEDQAPGITWDDNPGYLDDDDA